MADIHPTSLIDPEVEIAADAYIGPFCVLRGPVKIGPACKLHGNVYIHGPITIGRNNRIYPFSCLGFAPQDLKYDPAHLGAGVVIGDDNIFREGVTVHRATKDLPTRIGDSNFCMSGSHVGHDAVVGSRCIIGHGSMLGGHSQLFDNVNVGGNAGVHQFVRIGRMAMVAGQTAPTQDVPPFCIFHHNRRIGSLNVVGLRRSGLRAHVDPLRAAFRLYFESGMTAKNAIARIEAEITGDPLVTEFVEFLKTSKRGITKGGRAATEEE